MADREYHQQPEEEEEEGEGGGRVGHDHDHDDEAEELPWYRDAPQMAAMLSNFSTSYNAVNVSLVLPILELLHPHPESTAVSAVASSLLAGMMLGQLIGGALGDWVGVPVALSSVMTLQVVASFGSAVLCRESFWELALYRFVLGIGAGGVYPLAAVLSSGQNKCLHKVVLTFAMQGLGFIAVPLVALFLLHATTNLTLVWRILLGVGGIPGIVLLLLNRYNHHQARYSAASAAETPTMDEASHMLMEHDNPGAVHHADSVTEATGLSSAEEEEEEEEQDESRPGPSPSAKKPSIWEAIQQEENLVRKMLGTAATWFLFDILFYGNTLFQPIVIEAAFGTKDHTGPVQLLLRTAQDTFLLTAIALPGYAVAGLLLGRKHPWCYCGIKQTTRFVMLQGFAAMAILYLVIGVAWRDLQRSPALLVVLYGLTFFFANYGPNTTTFVLPSLVYSPDCRSTLNGICAAAGKMGALAGASLFGPLASSVGDANIMLLCAGVSVLAGALARAFVPVLEDGAVGPDGNDDNNDETYHAALIDESLLTPAAAAAPIESAEPA